MARWHYSFGHLQWDGADYREDVIILPDRSVISWPREHKHHLKFRYLAEVLQAAPRHLILGTGQSGVMDVPDTVLSALSEHGIDAEVMPTPKALLRLEALHAKGQSVAAALHLTC